MPRLLYVCFVAALSAVQPSGCGGCLPARQPPAATAPAVVPPPRKAPPKVYSRPEFQRAVLGLHERDLRHLLGAPDEIDRDGAWVYRRRTTDPETGAADRAARVSVENKVVAKVTFDPGPADRP